MKLKRTNLRLFEDAESLNNDASYIVQVGSLFIRKSTAQYWYTDRDKATRFSRKEAEKFVAEYEPKGKIIKESMIHNDENRHIENLQAVVNGNVTENLEDSTNDAEVLSPDMSSVYDSKNAVPIRMQLLRKAIAEETKSISDYEGFISSGHFTPEQNQIIQEIANDEKDHIVKWTRMLSEITDKEYEGFGNESLQPKSNKLKLF